MPGKLIQSPDGIQIRPLGPGLQKCQACQTSLQGQENLNFGFHNDDAHMATFVPYQKQSIINKDADKCHAIWEEFLTLK